MNSISFSQYSCWTTCPYQWKLIYIDDLKERSDNIHNIFGTAIHNTLQTYLKVMYDSSVKEADSLDLYNILFESMSTEYTLRKKNSPDINITNKIEMTEFYNDGIKIIDYFKKHRNKFFQKNNHILLGIEFPLSVKIKNNLIFHGYLDVVIKNVKTNKITIIDFKKSLYGWKPKIKNDPMKRAQLQLYKYFYSKMFNVNPNDIDVIFLILKQKLYTNIDFAQKRIQKVVPPSSKMTINKVYKELEIFINKCFTESGVHRTDTIYKKIPSNYNCKYCPFTNKPEMCNKKND